jgi:predicted HTH transcriptional regulator
MQTITIEQAIELAKTKPEQAVFDWKVDFVPPNDDDKRGEFLKDVSAIANACASTYGFILYGVDPRRPDAVCGISQRYDDARLQQLAKDKIDPLPEFLYYELPFGTAHIAVVQVVPSRRRPHIISVDMGRVRKGQILIRRGSSTDAVSLSDLFEFFYGQHSAHWESVQRQLSVRTNQQLADVAYMRELRAQADDALRDMEMITGVKLR